MVVFVAGGCTCVFASASVTICFFAVCNFPVSKNKLSVPPPPTPAAFLSQLHIPKSPFHGGLYLHPSWVLIPLCSLFALLFFLHLASLTGRWGIDRAVPQCQIWNRGSSPPCFHWPIIPFPTGLKGPSVTDNLPVREGETEEMREGVLSLSVPIVITCFFCYRFLMSRVLIIPLLLTFFLIFIPLHHTPSQLSLSSCYTATTMAWIWTIELRSRLFSVLLYTQGKLAEHRSDILGSDLNPNLYFFPISQNIVQSNISLIYTLVFHLLSKPSLHCTKNS